MQVEKKMTLSNTTTVPSPTRMPEMIIDGLVISKWSRELFLDMRAGGLTAANCTCSIWEGLEDTIRNVAYWKRLFRENSDLIMQVYTVDDIQRAKSEGKVGIILGWQNTSGLGDCIDSIELYAELGVRVIQLTYNTANYVGSGCYESRDSGLTDFGRDVIRRFNENGILVDLSHVGDKTAKEAIEFSNAPVTYSHVTPAGLHHHPRNKSDDQLRFIAQHGGFVGVATTPSFLRKGYDSSVDDYAEAIRYVANLVGEEQVGLATDSVQDQPPEFIHWISHDKGHGRRLVDLGGIPLLNGFKTLKDYNNIIDALHRAKFTDRQIENIAGANWHRFLTTVWR